jgi:hypothetical protein
LFHVLLIEVVRPWKTNVKGEAMELPVKDPLLEIILRGKKCSVLVGLCFMALQLDRYDFRYRACYIRY